MDIGADMETRKVRFYIPPGDCGRLLHPIDSELNPDRDQMMEQEGREATREKQDGRLGESSIEDHLLSRCFSYCNVA